MKAMEKQVRDYHGGTIPARQLGEVDSYHVEAEDWLDDAIDAVNQEPNYDTPDSARLQAAPGERSPSVEEKSTDKPAAGEGELLAVGRTVELWLRDMEPTRHLDAFLDVEQARINSTPKAWTAHVHGGRDPDDEEAA